MIRERRGKPTYNSSVFINCPFDLEYRPLFRALVFTIEACGFFPRCALEVDDAGETRAEKLIRLIRHSRYGIHDISRTELTNDQLPRFNMPYEFGLFVGLKHSEEPRQKSKALLVLDREPYRFQKFMSDIAGQDIQSHEGTIDVLITKVRHWLQNQSKENLPGSAGLIQRFATFTQHIPQNLALLGKTEADLENFRDLQQLIYTWLNVERDAAKGSIPSQ